MMRSAAVAVVGLSFTSVALADPDPCEIDTDGDGYPDCEDYWPEDPTMWDSLMYWGGQYWVDGNEEWIYGAIQSYQWVDTDGDYIPDPDDPYPNDNTNNSTGWGNEGYYMIEGEMRWFEARWLRTDTMLDTDGDGLQDSFDPYPFDDTNHSFGWGGSTYRVDGQDQYFEYRYLGSLEDSDGDGIPDQVDPYQYDPTNNEPPPPPPEDP